VVDQQALHFDRPGDLSVSFHLSHTGFNKEHLREQTQGPTRSKSRGEAMGNYVANSGVVQMNFFSMANSHYLI
jgi:hypothetical protein